LSRALKGLDVAGDLDGVIAESLQQPAISPISSSTGERRSAASSALRLACSSSSWSSSVSVSSAMLLEPTR
jgi:hypothetical protein